MIPPPKQAAHRAFSLLELMTALAVFLLLAAGVFVLVAGTSQLFEDVARFGAKHSLPVCLAASEVLTQRAQDAVRCLGDALGADLVLGVRLVAAAGRNAAVQLAAERTTSFSGHDYLPAAAPPLLLLGDLAGLFPRHAALEQLLV